MEEVQKYAGGKLIYIPKTEKSKGWGEASGYRDKLNKRNAAICSRYSSGSSIMEIAEEFFLSPETIKKLVYGKKVSLPMFSPTISSAEQYASAGMGEEWVRTYLATLDESIPDISEYFMSELVRIPLRLIESSDATGNTADNSFAAGTTDSGHSSDTYVVPLIVLYDNKKFTAPFQPGYLPDLKAQKLNSHYAFVFAKNEDYNSFWNNYGKNFRR